MIRTVLANTSSRVKFWLLANYASPAFRNFMPLMAAHHGFDFEARPSAFL